MTTATAQLIGTPTTGELVGDVPGAERTYTRTSAVESSYQVRTELGFDLKAELNEQGWTVLDRVTGIFGVGREPNDAVKDLRFALIEHRDVLESQGALSPELSNQLDYLRARLPHQA